MTQSPGWYPRGDVMQYWDGISWTDQTQPRPRDETNEPDDGNALVICGYIFAVIIPFIGFVLGIVCIAKSSRRLTKHGIAMLVISVIAFVVWIAIVAAGASHTCVDAYGNSYSCS